MRAIFEIQGFQGENCNFRKKFKWTTRVTPSHLPISLSFLETPFPLLSSGATLAKLLPRSSLAHVVSLPLLASLSLSQLPSLSLSLASLFHSLHELTAITRSTAMAAQMVSCSGEGGSEGADGSGANSMEANSWWWQGHLFTSADRHLLANLMVTLGPNKLTLPHLQNGTLHY